MKKLIILLLLMFSFVSIDAQTLTIKDQMKIIQNMYDLHFVYDSQLNLNVTFNEQSLAGKSLNETLDALFKSNGIAWKRRGNNILLTRMKKKKPTLARYTLSGYVRDRNGESIISATIFDDVSHCGTISNEFGFYSITLSEGKHSFRVSCIGFDEKKFELSLHENRQMNVQLADNNTLAEVVIEGDLNSPLLRTQTGKRTLAQKDFNTEFALLSSPDVVKTLQRISGVAEGVELTSGLYVHGGGSDENLFLLDGTPLYQINHSLGLFSSFNTDMIKQADFFKSGFPARYNGRVSSITDVRTRDGNMNKVRGTYSVGMLDGRFQIEGPIIKDKLSFNFGLRRSWIDLLLRPIFALTNCSSDGEHYSFDYLFHDLNGKITYVFSDRSRAFLSVYSGKDKYNIRDKSVWMSDVCDTRSNFDWGNQNMALNWNYRLSNKMYFSLAGIFTKNISESKFTEDETGNNGYEERLISQTLHKNKAVIYDTGVKADFDYRPGKGHRILFGTGYTYHIFKPQTFQKSFYYNSSENYDTTMVSGRNFQRSHEMTLYFEDEFRMNERLNFDFGLNGMLFGVKGKCFWSLDPRMAVKYHVCESVSAKASFTRMSQYVHRIVNTYLDMPTDFWVPTTKNIKPVRSSQIAAGLYTQINKSLLLTIEGFYKHSSHLVQYKNWMGLQPPASLWDQNVIDGVGKSYGLELDAFYQTPQASLSATYTLSWSKRKFSEFYDSWFRDKFDNRHKLNLNGRYRFNDRCSCYAAWTYHSGNRISVPTQFTNFPQLPGETRYEEGFIYEKPNNVALPAYHRLDVGFDFKKKTKCGHERIWNVSLYNAYCHFNTMYANVKQDDNGNFQYKCKGYIPIIPSVSYTIKF